MSDARRLLVTLIALDDAGSCPSSLDRIAAVADMNPQQAARVLDRLGACALVEGPPDTDGFRPTVTAHELLERRLDEGGIVVEDPNGPVDDRP